MSKFKNWAKKTGFSPRTKPLTAAPPPAAAPQTEQGAPQGSVTLYTSAGQAVTLNAAQLHQPPPGQPRLIATHRPNQMVHPNQVPPRRSSVRHAPECMIVKPDEYTGYTDLLHQLPDMVETGHCPNLNPDGVNMLTAFGVPEGGEMRDWTPNARAYNGATERAPNVDAQMQQRHQEGRAAARYGGSHSVTATARGELGRKID